jgi:hypothetical protein
MRSAVEPRESFWMREAARVSVSILSSAASQKIVPASVSRRLRPAR